MNKSHGFPCRAKCKINLDQDQAAVGGIVPVHVPGWPAGVTFRLTRIRSPTVPTILFRTDLNEEEYGEGCICGSGEVRS